MNTHFTPLSQTHIEELIKLLGSELVFTEPNVLQQYGHDETEDLLFLPEIVIKPREVEQISQLVKFCNQYQIAITPRGAGTGLSGGALPVCGGVLLSMEHFNQIIAIDEQNLQATVESGVITETLIEAVAEKNLLYPIDPASKGSCFLGGNVAHGSGGPRVVKYGTIRDYILNLQVVLPNGEIIWTGANTIKFSSGYNLTQLFIGSEGTLGIITKIVVKLIPKPAHNLLLLASFESNEVACTAVSAIFSAGITPSAVEFMERVGVEWVMKYDQLTFDIKPHAQAFLLVEIDGNYLEQLFLDCEKINELFEKFGSVETLLAESTAQKETLWRIRRTMAVSVKSNSIYKEEDIVVPRATLPQAIKNIKKIGVKYGFESVIYGHAGDGNLHVNILKGDMNDHDWHHKLPIGIQEIFEQTVALGGTISGEHGIGWVQRPYMGIKFSEMHLQLMRAIKHVFDPKGILNPCKIY